MATFLNTTGVSYALEELIRGADERLVLISPFLRVNQRIRDLLADKDRLKIDTRVVYGKSELSKEESEWLSSTPSIRTSYCANLHAKCYLNEKKALVTSMNLYEFSQVNNIEMGVLVDRGEDGPLYDAIYEAAQAILRGSEEHNHPHRLGAVQQKTTKRDRSQTANGDASARKGTRRRKPSASDGGDRRGFCIRCRGGLTADPCKPYCAGCFKSWARYENKVYKENHCHLCGKDHHATLQRPVCRPCFKRHKTSYTFPTG